MGHFEPQNPDSGPDFLENAGSGSLPTVIVADPGSGMGKKSVSGSGIRDEQPG